MARCQNDSPEATCTCSLATGQRVPKGRSDSGTWDKVMKGEGIAVLDKEGEMVRIHHVFLWPRTQVPPTQKSLGSRLVSLLLQGGETSQVVKECVLLHMWPRTSTISVPIAGTPVVGLPLLATHFTQIL